MAQENTEKKKKVLYNPDGTSVEEKDDRSTQQGKLSVKKKGIPSLGGGDAEPQIGQLSVKKKGIQSLGGGSNVVLPQGVENAPVPPAQVVGTPDVSVTPMQGVQSVQPVQQPQSVQGVQGVQPAQDVQSVQPEAQTMPAPPAVSYPQQETPDRAEEQNPDDVIRGYDGQAVGAAPQGVGELNKQVSGVSGTPEPQGDAAGDKKTLEAGDAQQGTPIDYYAKGAQYTWSYDQGRADRLSQDIAALGLKGNVNHGNRKMVSGSDLAAKGWTFPKGSDPSKMSDTLWGMEVGFGTPKVDKKGSATYKNKLLMTPITSQGRILSQEEMGIYLQDLEMRTGGDVKKVLDADKPENGGFGLLIGTNVSQESRKKLASLQGEYYETPGYDALKANAARNVAGASAEDLDAYKKQVEEYYKGVLPDEWDPYVRAMYDAVGEELAKPSQPAVTNNGKITTNENNTTSGASDAKPNSTRTLSSSTIGDFKDEELQKIYDANVGKDSDKARQAAQMAADELTRRGKPPVKDDDVKDEEDEEGSAPSVEDAQRNIDVLEQILKDEKASEAAKKEAEERLAEWKKVMDTPAPSTSPSGLKDDDKLHDGTTVKDYKAIHKDTSKEVIKTILDATRGLEGYDNDIKALEELYVEKGGVLEKPKKESKPEAKLEDMPNYKDAVADRDRKQAELDELLKSKDSYKAVALEQYNKWRKDEGLSEEDEKKVEKRHRTARIIANIGDVLQGFANLAGTWYGANSSSLTSLSATAGAAQEKELTAREKRRDKLQKNYETLLAQLKKDGDTDIAQRVAALKAANDRLNKISDSFYTEQNKQRNRKEAQEHATEEHGKRQKITTEEANKRVAYKADEQKKIDDNRAKHKLNQISSTTAGQIAVAKERGLQSRKTKSTPSYHDLHGGSSKKSKKSKKRKGGVRSPLK